MPRDRIDYSSISTRLEPHDVWCDCGGYAEHVRDDCEGLEDTDAPVRQMPRREPRR